VNIQHHGDLLQVSTVQKRQSIGHKTRCIRTPSCFQHIRSPCQNARPPVAAGLKPFPERRFGGSRTAGLVKNGMGLVAVLKPALNDIVTIPPSLARHDQGAALSGRHRQHQWRRGQIANQVRCQFWFRPQTREPAELGNLDQAWNRRPTLRKTIRQRDRQGTLNIGGRDTQRSDLFRHAPQDLLLVPRVATGDRVGILHALPLLQQQHRHLAVTSLLQGNADALGTAAIRQRGTEVVDRPGRRRGLLGQTVAQGHFQQQVNLVPGCVLRHPAAQNHQRGEDATGQIAACNTTGHATSRRQPDVR
jgi:hypothetical protein